MTLVTMTGTLHVSGLHLQFHKGEKIPLKDHVKPCLLKGNSLFASKATFIDQVGINWFNFVIRLVFGFVFF